MASKKEANINIEGDMIVNTGKSSNVNNRETRSASSNNIFDKIIYSNDQNKDLFAKNNQKEINDVLKNAEELVKNLSSVIEKNTKDPEEKKEKSSKDKITDEEKNFEEALNKYDYFLKKKKEIEEKETSLKDRAVNTVKAIPKALDDTAAMKGWKTHGAIAVASAINPLAGAGLQLLLSDQFKGFGSSILKSITGEIKHVKDEKKKKNELKEEEVELQKKIVNAYKNLSGNVDEVYKRMEGSVENFNPEQLLLELTTKVKNAKVESKTSNSDSVNGLTEEKVTDIVKANSLNKDDVVKVQAQDTRTESEKAVASSKTERALNGEKEEKKADSGESFISKLFKNAWSAIKKHWLGITGLILFYFSSDQFKAYVKDLITIPFRRLWQNIKENGLISGLFSKDGALAAATSAALYYVIPGFIKSLFWKVAKVGIKLVSSLTLKSFSWIKSLITSSENIRKLIQSTKNVWSSGITKFISFFKGGLSKLRTVFSFLPKILQFVKPLLSVLGNGLASLSLFAGKIALLYGAFKFGQWLGKKIGIDKAGEAIGGWIGEKAYGMYKWFTNDDKKKEEQRKRVEENARKLANGEIVIPGAFDYEAVPSEKVKNENLKGTTMTKAQEKVNPQITVVNNIKSNGVKTEKIVPSETKYQKIKLNINSNNKEVLNSINDIFAYNTQYIAKEITSKLLLLRDVLNQISVNTAGNKIITSSNDSSATMSLPR